jgi:photosystem II stability/assembly factor-like uncharacterized protein
VAIEAQTAFISYSREDSEFALKLAEDLKAAGAAVWLDQLDIAPGQRWAQAVQNALNDCPRMLVILSPSSASSTNVDDEVSFALEEKKTVIPVLHRDCKIPFRLRPFQFVDFRGNYDLGLKKLLRALPAQPLPEQTVAPTQEAPPGASKEALIEPAAELEHPQEDTADRRLPRPEEILPAIEEVQTAVSENGGLGPPVETEQTKEENKQAAGEERTEEPREIPSEAEIQSVVSDDVHSEASALLAPRQAEIDQSAGPAQPEPEGVQASESSFAGPALPEEEAGAPRAEFGSTTEERVEEETLIRVEPDRDQNEVFRDEGKGRSASVWLSNNRGRVRVVAALCGLLIAGAILYLVSRPDWKKQVSGTDEDLLAVTFPTPQSGWVVGQIGILHTEDAGRTWASQEIPVKGYFGALNSVAFATPQSGWAVGDQGIILRTTDSGRTWIQQISTVTKRLFSVAVASPQSAWAVGEDGVILHTEDGGTTWKAPSSGTELWLFSVVFLSPQSGWAAGASGTILHTEDGGATWKVQSSGEGEIRSLAIVSSQSSWALHYALIHTEDGGRTWKDQGALGSQVLYLNALTFPTPDQGWAVGNEGLIIHTADGGATWSKQSTHSTEDLKAVAFPTPQSGWAVGREGRILHWEK